MSLTVVQARCVADRVVRVVWDAQPLARSASGSVDALNPANYALTAVDGTVVNPGTGLPAAPVILAVVAVGPGPSRWTNAGQWWADVQADRSLILGITYQMVVTGVQGVDGSTVATNASQFPGSLPLAQTRPQRAPSANTDIANPAWTWTFLAGDAAPEASAQDGVKKRAVRRLTTTPGGFRFLGTTYGCLPVLKGLIPESSIPTYQAQAVAQLMAEPDIVSATCLVTLLPEGVMTVAAELLTPAGVVPVTVTHDGSGGITVT